MRQKRQEQVGQYAGNIKIETTLIYVLSLLCLKPCIINYYGLLGGEVLTRKTGKGESKGRGC